MNIQPMKVDVPQAVLDDLRERLLRVRWPNEIPDSGWDYGTNLGYMKELVDYWLNEYDWRTEERRLNQFSHYKADVGELGIHFVHEKGQGPNPMPLLMMHGYPWSVATLYQIIPMLTDPASCGGDSEDAFTVIAPSLCGFCLSDPPLEKGFSFPQHADKFHELMVDGLDYQRYGLEGGDWGGIIAWPYGYNYPDELIGIHINYMGIRMRDEVPPEERDPNLIRGVGLQGAPIKPQDPDQLRFWKAAEHYWLYEGAYAHTNMTRPQSLSYAMTDSPVGLAAWFIEKFRAWSDWDDDFETLFSKDELITNIMLYWVPNTFCSAIRIYYESHHHPWRVKPGDKVKVPTGVAAFPKDIVPIIKSQAEKYFNVARFNEFPRGGHFAIHEKAEVLAADIRDFFRPLREQEK
jgi:microsomal epoxide hydrolase